MSIKFLPGMKKCEELQSASINLQNPRQTGNAIGDKSFTPLLIS
jgi:hypothetical protein